MGERLVTDRAAAYVGLRLTAFRRIAVDDKIPRTRGPGGWLYARADLDAYLEAARIRPGDVSYLPKPPASSGRYIRSGSSHTPHR